MDKALEETLNNRAKIANVNNTKIKYREMKDLQNSELRRKITSDKYHLKNEEKDELDHLIRNQKQKHRKELDEISELTAHQNLKHANEK